MDLDVSEEVAFGLGLTKADVFNLTVRDVSPGGNTEKFLHITFKDHARRVDRVLAANSKLVRWEGEEPADSLVPTAGTDDVTSAEKALKAAKEADPDADTSAEEAALSAAKEALAASDGANLVVNDFTGPGLENSEKGIVRSRASRFI